MSKDNIKFQGITLVEGSPSGAGNKRFFGKMPYHSTDVIIDGETYTLYAEVKAYHKGSAPRTVGAEEYDSDKESAKTKREQKATKVASQAPLTSDGGSSGNVMEALAKLMTIVESQGKVVARLVAAAE